MAGQFKNAPIGFKQGMRFKTALGWREVLTVRDGTAICRTISGEAPGFSWVYQEPTETMLLDLDHPWIGRKYKSHDGLVSEVVCMTDKQVFVQWAAETDPCAFTLDFFKKHFTPIPLEPPFKVCSEAIGMMNAAEAVWDSWRRTAERLENEIASLKRTMLTKHRQRSEELQARVNVLEEAVTEALVAAKAEWNLVLRHPASRFAGDVAYYESVLYPQAREMLGEDKP